MDKMLHAFLMRTNHGKNIVEVGNNSWLVLEAEGSGRSQTLGLLSVQLDDDGGQTISEAINLAGCVEEACLRVEGSVISSAMAAGPDGSVYVAVSDETGTTILQSISPVPTSLAKLAEKESWRPLAGHGSTQRSFDEPVVVGDLLFTEKAELVITTCRPSRMRKEDKAGYAVWDGQWRHQELATGHGLFPPTCTLDENSQLHFTWSDVYQRVFYASASLDTPETHSPAALFCAVGRQPTVTITPEEKVLLAFESETSHAIHYAVVQNGKVNKYEDDEAELTHADPRFSREMVHSPQFARDEYGVPWLFFVNIIRRYVFACRWLGDGWSPIFEVAGVRHLPTRRDYRYLPIGRYSVTRNNPALDKAALALHLQAEEPTSGRSFSRIPTLKYEMKPGHKILFLDMQEVAGSHNVRVLAGQAEKCEANPLLESRRGSFESRWCFVSGSVMQNKGRFQLWHTGVGEYESTVPWWHWYRIGYAESDDGVKWQRKDLSFRQSPDQNMVPDMPPTVAICRDDHESDPERRYKVVQFYIYSYFRELVLKGELDPTLGQYQGRLYTSADGLNWRHQPIEISCPGDTHLEFIPQCLFRDEEEPNAEKRFKAYGWTSLTQGQRAVSLATSPDAIHWTAHKNNPVLAPDLRGHPYVPAGPDSHIHDAVVFKYGGYYLALYQYLRNCLDADLELAMSRDGENFTYVNCGEKVIRRGEPGTWDSGMLTPSTPLIVDDQIWFYYGGTDYSHESDEPVDLSAEDKLKNCMGLAKLRLDGFTSLQLKDNTTEGQIETIPLHVSQQPFQVILNADCRQGQIQVECVDATTGKVLPDYSFDSCNCMEVDSVRFPVTWSNRPGIEKIRSPLILRLRLKGKKRSPQLYSIGFA
jgi:hypothetical protein